MNKPLILVVEDDAAVKNLITTTLETHQYRFRTASTGETAVMEAVSHNPDVILLDPFLVQNSDYRAQRQKRGHR